MRVVFMGTPAFAVPSLRMLHERHEVVAVYTRPDAVSGRGRLVSPSPVKVLADDLRLPGAQPATLREPDQVAALAALSPDLIAVAAYGLLLPEPVLSAARMGCVNVHASLLPRWRGAAPIERAILAGDRRTGVSIMRMERGLDTGPFATQVEVDVDGKTTEGLSEELGRAGADALSGVIDAWESASVVWTPQDESRATYAEKITAADVKLDPLMSTVDAERRVRAASRHAPSRVVIGERVVSLLAVRVSSRALGPGLAACHVGLTLGMADGALEVLELVPAGRSRMNAADFTRGAHLADTCAWGPA